MDGFSFIALVTKSLENGVAKGLETILIFNIRCFLTLKCMFHAKIVTQEVA